MHHYNKLQEKIDSHIIGAPKCEEFLEILKILVRPDEVELATSLEFKLQKARDLARKEGDSLEDVIEKLESMANRGSILAKVIDGEHSYALLPSYPGLFEYPVMKGLDEQTRDRLAKLWHAYYMKAMSAELASANPPWNRIIPSEEAIPDEPEILPFEIASRMIEKNEIYAVANCPCRILGGNCDKPLEVCLCFDGVARFLTERGMAKLISIDEARDILKKSEHAGLVHTGSNSTEKLSFLCNCCPCCCHLLMLLTKKNLTEAIAKSSYRAKFNVESCIGCGVCHERCPVGAFNMNGEVADYDSTKCIGCGLCISTCPTAAIVLFKREEYTRPPDTMRELVKKIAVNKKTTSKHL